ncbi:hypothetical protein FG05_12594 [Fusarium graminearum]|nr:hypothetical protein FG05_12594 [Fusarium graminearum]
MAELLCSDCLLFEESLQNYSSKYSHRTLKSNITSLKESAQQGCSLCRVIYQSFIYDEGILSQNAEAPIEIWTKDSVIDPDSQESRLDILSVKVQQRGSNRSTPLPVLFNGGSQEQAFESYKGLVGQIEDPTSDQGIKNLACLTASWIQNCRNTHSQCGHRVFSVDIDVVPTRLIDVGTNNSSQPPRLCLPRKDRSSENIEYVALSYAWGPVNNSHSGRTTASNLEEMIRGLPFSQLPKTIQDAIIFTRKLGFRYLWVDALCILQSEGPHDTSHQEDWSHEATRFGYYYQNAAITIAATGARSSDDGLFLPRPALAFDPNPVILRRKRLTGETRDISILPNLPSWISEIKRAPLYERGWAIQERILSARVVHFAANMVLWECHECRATEIDHVGSSLSNRHNGMVYEEVSDFMPIIRKLQLQGGAASQVVREWYSFVEGYTSAKFTFMGDRLPALSGITALIQRHIPEGYGAGLWQSAVPEGLAWLIEDELIEDVPDPVSPPVTKAELQQMLPSWSWAASRGTVRFLSSLDSWDPVLEMEDWDVKSAGVDTSGQILRIHEPRPMRVICIGAGISGIAATYKAQRQLVNTELIIYEKNHDVGGTWLENKYPGCACDIPAHSYTFSWEGNPKWSRFYVEAPEILQYLKDCVSKWGCMEFIKLRHRVIAAKWDESSHKWNVQIEGPDGETFTDICDVVISATGPLNKWQWPDIPGLESFKGLRLHPARWDTSVDLIGKRVAVIGAGSSALQIVPTIQPVVSQLTNFIRSPTWITAEYGQAFASEGRETRFTEEQIKLFQSDKSALLEYRRKLLDGATKGFDIYYKDTDMQKQAFIADSKLMRERLQNNEEICSKLVPDFGVGCRRVSPGNGYLESLIKPNAKAIFDGIKCVNESGILDNNNNIQHDFDIIICATGFDVSHRLAFPVLGCGGQNLRDVWSQGPTHYLSVAAPGFPNYWIGGGPSAPIRNVSLIMGLELAVDYAFSCVRKMQAEGIASLEVEEDAAKEFMEQRDKIMKDLVWTGSCASWYKNSKNDNLVTGPWCGSIWHYKEALENPRWEGYKTKYLGKNRFAYFGNGRTVPELRGESMATKYLNEIGLQ